MKKQLSFYIYGIIVMTFCCCKKDWLDEKRDIKLVVPTTLADARLLMNNYDVLTNDNTGITELAAGDFYMTTETWKALTFLPDQRAYSLQNPYKGEARVIEWDGAYKQIEVCNVVLELLNKIVPDETNYTEWADLKGAALFYRARAFFNLAQVFALPFSKDNLEKPGVPLRTSSDINAKVTRASINDTYNLITYELKASAKLLKTVPITKANASKPAAYGQLARCFLSMEDYANAKLYADSCLELYNHLLNYNDIDTTSFTPFPLFNDEVIIQAGLNGNSATFYFPRGMIQKEIIDMYSDNDLRKTLFFRKNSDAYSMKSFYYGYRVAFGGLATDEIYLIRAEALARLGDANLAMTNLNTVLATRYKTGTFVHLTAANSDDALGIILRERRKELLLRGVRWSDLRRLNKDLRFAVTITKIIDNQTYKLAPNDFKYVYPLPDYVIRDYKVEQNQGW